MTTSCFGTCGESHCLGRSVTEDSDHSCIFCSPLMRRHSANTVHARPAERTWSASLSGQDACLRPLAGVRSRFGGVSASEHGDSVPQPPWCHSVHSHRGLCSHQQGVRCSVAVWETRRRRQRPCAPVGSQHPLRIHRCPPWQTIGSRGSSSSDAASKLLLPALSVHVGRAAMAAEGVVLRIGCQTTRSRMHRAPLQSTGRLQADTNLPKMTIAVSPPAAHPILGATGKSIAALGPEGSLVSECLRLQVLECLRWPAAPAQQGAAEQP